jgi:hypothetical protein
MNYPLSPMECVMLRLNPSVNPRTGRYQDPCAPYGNYQKQIKECECLMATNPTQYGQLKSDPKFAPLLRALGLEPADTGINPAVAALLKQLGVNSQPNTVTGASNLSDGTMFWEVLVEGPVVTLKEGVVGGIPKVSKINYGTSKAASENTGEAIKWMMGKGFHV